MTEELPTRRKRLLYRSWHRGTKELDLFIGSFADRHLSSLSPEQLDRYEAILERNETDIYAWISRREPVPPELDNDVMAMILAFRFGESSR